MALCRTHNNPIQRGIWASYTNGLRVVTRPYWNEEVINILRPKQNGRYFPDDICKCIFLNETVWISIKISLKFVPDGPINNIPAIVQMMA